MSLLSQSKDLNRHALTLATGQKSLLEAIHLETTLLDRMAKISTLEHWMSSWTV
jgi:hypothetical protein